MDGNHLGGGLGALGWTAASAGTTAPGLVAGAGVALLFQLVEVMAGDVAMYRKELGYLGAGQRLRRLAQSQVDAPPGRVAERRRETADVAVELVPRRRLVCQGHPGSIVLGPFMPSEKGFHGQSRPT
ncbi:hypothetical protein BH18ACT6_BH18ACT6_10660 [soil metagenome]